MEESRWLARYGVIALAIVGGLEWLLGRTVSRMASAPNLEGTPRTIIEGLGKVGYYLVSPVLILLVVLLLLAAFLAGASSARQERLASGIFALYLAVFAIFTAAHTVLPTERWLNITFNLLSLICVWWLVALAWLNPSLPRRARIAVTLTGLAYLGWYIYVLQELIGGTGTAQGQFGLVAVTLGELLAVATPYAFFAAIALPEGRWRHPRRWIAPIALALVFAAGNIADTVLNMGFTGVFTTWSLGFNMPGLTISNTFIPLWPLYAVALALFVYSILTSFATHSSTPTPTPEPPPTAATPNPAPTNYANPNTGFGLLFLLTATYTLQVQYLHLLAILSLLLLTAFFTPFTPSPVPEPATAPTLTPQSHTPRRIPTK